MGHTTLTVHETLAAIANARCQAERYDKYVSGPSWEDELERACDAAALEVDELYGCGLTERTLLQVHRFFEEHPGDELPVGLEETEGLIGAAVARHVDAAYQVRFPGHDCSESPWNHETTDGPLGDAYTCSVCGELMQVG